MKLLLSNIGLIKEAKINLDGLTVIAGKNDSGKSTVLKTIFSIIKSDNIANSVNADEKRAKKILATRFNYVFDGNISEDGKIKLLNVNDEEIINIVVKNDNYIERFKRNSKDREKLFDATFIPSPLIFDFVDFFNSVSKMKETKFFELGIDFDIKYPYIMWDLYVKLTKDNPFPKAKSQRIIDKIINELIRGNFIVERNGNVSYLKNNEGDIKKIEMFNTAMGIKSFGILQLLNQNRFLHPKYILLIDEPEVHLHPEWELKMAELIVQIVKVGVKVVVTSHSPYMIEALYLYSQQERITNDFYLAENNVIQKQENLSNIFKLLAIPMKKLQEMKYRKNCES